MLSKLGCPATNERSEESRRCGKTAATNVVRSGVLNHDFPFPLRLMFCAKIVRVRIVAIAAIGHDSHEYDSLSVDTVAAGPVS